MEVCGAGVLSTFCGGSQGAAAVGGVHKGFADFSKWQEIKIHLYKTCPFIVYELSRGSATAWRSLAQKELQSSAQEKRCVSDLGA